MKVKFLIDYQGWKKDEIADITASYAMNDLLTRKPPIAVYVLDEKTTNPEEKQTKKAPAKKVVESAPVDKSVSQEEENDNGN